MPTKKGWSFLETVILWMLTPVLLMALVADLGSNEQREAGKKIYEKRCTQCHGESGAGDGPAQKFLKPWPRNFAKGIYKFKSTPDDRLPTTDDLMRVIRLGNPYTGMPAWPQLSEEEIRSLAYYIKSFAEDFASPASLTDEALAPVPLSLPSKVPDWSEASSKKGKELFVENKCIDCHGPAGRGSGKSAPTTEGIDGRQIRPRDLTKRWTFRNGNSRMDIFRTISVGLNPMPSFHKLPEEDRWSLVDYVMSLGARDAANYSNVVISQEIQGDLDFSKGEELFAKALPAYFPIVGQVTQSGRAFFPSADGIGVKSVFNDDEIAFFLSWHDMSAETGTLAASASPATGADDSGWGEEKSAAATEDDGWGSGEESAAPPEQKNAPDTPVTDFTEETVLEKPYQSSDAVAIQIPSKTPEGFKKPYFIFGDKKLAVDLWFADLANAKDHAQGYVSKGAENIQANDEDLPFASKYEDGRWTAIFKRKRHKEGGVSFESSGFVPIAFSVWDGFNSERGNKRGITSWFHVYLKPYESGLSKALIFHKMLLAALLVGILEIIVLRLVRRKKGMN